MTPDEIIQALREPFNACELEYRDKPFKAVYVDARTMVRRLNDVLPLRWSFRLMPEIRVDNSENISRDGVLVIHTEHGDREFYSTGTETKDFSAGEPKSEKGADSDTFKRCCFRAGLGAYLYEIKGVTGNALNAQQVEQAARQAGYTGAIKPEHYGPMLPSRAVSSKSPEPARTETRPQSPPPSSPRSEAQGTTVKAETAREKYNRLANELFGDAKNKKAELDAFIAQQGVSLSAETMPLIIAKMEAAVAANQPPAVLGGAS